MTDILVKSGELTKIKSKPIAAGACAALLVWNCRGALSYALRPRSVDSFTIGYIANFTLLFVCSVWLFRRLSKLSAAGGKQLAAGDPWQGLAIGFLSFSVCNALLLALAPPTEWDVLAYHLALPRLYFRAGRIYEIPWLFHSHYPHLMELLYAPLLALDERLPALLHAAACLAWTAAVFSSIRRRFSARTAWIAAALCASQPLALRFSGVAHSDGALAMFVWLSTSVLWRWTEEKRARLLLAAGLLSGLGAATKLVGFAPAAALAAWVWSRDGVKSFVRFSAPALAVVAPWLLKDWLWAGNPVWPFLPEVFGGAWGGPSLAAPLLRSATATAPLTQLLFAAPPLAFAAAGGAFLARRRLPFWIFIPGAATLALFWRNNEAWRYLWLAYPALALAAAEGLPPWLALGACLTGLCAAPCGNAAFAAWGLRPSSGTADRRAAYLSRATDHFDFYRDVNTALAGEGARVLLFREIRGYYLEVEYLWGDPLNQGLVRYGECANASALLARLRALKVTHVLINEGLALYAPGSVSYDARTVDLMNSLLARSRQVLRRGDLSLFELPPPALVE